MQEVTFLNATVSSLLIVILIKKIFLIAGNSLELLYYNIIGNNRCECLKNKKIGQSAAKYLYG